MTVRKVDANEFAKKAGFDALRRANDQIKPEPLLTNIGGSKDQQATDSAPHFSDEALAITFAQRHADNLRYVAKFGRWMSWTGQFWRSDDTLHAFNLARDLSRSRRYLQQAGRGESARLGKNGGGGRAAGKG